MLSPTISQAVRIFYSYAATIPGDKVLFDKLKNYLVPVVQKGEIDDAYDSGRLPNSNIKASDLDGADIIVVLISPDYLSLQYLEMMRAIEREKTGKTRLIPVLLRHANWRESPLWEYEILPSNGKPVQHQPSRDMGKALLEVSEKILTVARAASARIYTETQIPLPCGHSQFFTDREDILTAIHTYFTSIPDFQQMPLALSGMFGYGKTQIAAEYAYRSSKKYQPIIWLDATSLSHLKETLVPWAEPLSFSLQDRADDQHLFDALKRWLQKHNHWLLIFDNLNDLQLLNRFIPFQKNGHVLLTTYSQAVGELAHPIRVEHMAPKESALFLLRRANIIGEQASLNETSEIAYIQASRIVQEFGSLTLALDQAGAYIEETRCGCIGYLELYHEKRRELLKRRGKLVRTHPSSVTATFLLLFQAVEGEYPVALELLYLFAFLQPDAIPLEMIEQGASALDGSLRTLATEAINFYDAIAVLRKYSLTQDHTDPTLLSIHRIVQAILIEELMPRQQHRWATQAVRLMNRVFPEPVFKNWPTCERYFSQARKCAKNITEYGIKQKEAGHLLQRLGTYCYQRAYYQDAENYLTTALQLYEQAKTPDPPARAQTLNNLALIYYQQGNYREAETHFQSALAIRTQLYGPDHPTIAQTLNNQALLYMNWAKYQQAEELYQQVRLIDECTVGPDHLDTATALSNLAAVYKEQGKYAQAEPLDQRAFSIENHSLDTDHPRLALSLNIKGAQYEDQGRYSEAEELYQQALAIQMRTVGPNHPETAQSLNNLAGLYEIQQRYQEAEEHYRRALAIYQQIFGPEHPDTATILHNLGYLFCQQGQYQDAEEKYQQALAIYEKAYASSHPDMATALHNLGSLYCLMGEVKRAEPLLQRGLAIREHFLGRESLDTAQSLGALIELLSHQHRYEQAKPLYQRFLNIMRQACGPESPDVAEAQEQYTILLERINEQREGNQSADDALR